MTEKTPTRNRRGEAALRPQSDTASVGAELRSARNLERCPQRHG